MYKIVHGSTHGLSDVASFIETLNRVEQSAGPETRGLFDPAGEIVVGRAPARLDLMGGIADYSGSLVLQWPLGVAVLAAVQRDASRRLRIVSLGVTSDQPARAVEMPLGDLESAGEPLDYETARAYFQRRPEQHWAAYVAGAFSVLMRERGSVFHEGARILVASSVPEGKGISSSAALEVATFKALSAAFGIELSAADLAVLCQKVENQVVGAPCGVMDQMTSSCGEAGRLLALLCQPAQLLGNIDLPQDVSVWGLDSGIRHAVSGADYGSVRIGAFMGYRMVAEVAGLEVQAGSAGGPVRVRDPNWNGYLANVTPLEFEKSYAHRLPERLSGAEFLKRFGGTTDPVTTVDPNTDYAVRQPTAHPIYEHFRVRAFAELLKGTLGERPLELLGELMYQSHASYSACGLGSDGTDRLVELVRQAGPTSGLYGAKITGGGSGGTVAVLGRRDATEAVESIATQYSSETGHPPRIFSGSSPGAAAFGYLKLRKG